MGARPLVWPRSWCREEDAIGRPALPATRSASRGAATEAARSRGCMCQGRCAAHMHGGQGLSPAPAPAETGPSELSRVPRCPSPMRASATPTAAPAAAVGPPPARGAHTWPWPQSAASRGRQRPPGAWCRCPARPGPARSRSGPLGSPFGYPAYCYKKVMCVSVWCGLFACPRARFLVWGLLVGVSSWVCVESRRGVTTTLTRCKFVKVAIRPLFTKK